MKLSNAKIRNFDRADMDAVARLINEAFRGLEYNPRMKIGLENFIPEGSFVAERDNAIVGCIGTIKLGQEGWFEVRNLATKDSDPGVQSKLVSHALDYAQSRNPRLVKAFTPAVQPYVDAYKQAGFEPIRRSLRVRWDVPTAVPRGKEEDVQTRLLSGQDADEAGDAWVAGLRPYWDWWIEENGGAKEVADWVKSSVPKDPGWIGAFSKGKLVGLSILRSDAYGPGDARFNGAYTIPEYRGQGVGRRLMDATLQEAARTGQKVMRVYTIAYLDHLAPGAVLYLKTGGRIEAEYLQLQIPEK